jgi:hypothetical protein
MPRQVVRWRRSTGARSEGVTIRNLAVAVVGRRPKRDRCIDRSEDARRSAQPRGQPPSHVVASPPLA